MLPLLPQLPEDATLDQQYLYYIARHLELLELNTEGETISSEKENRKRNMVPFFRSSKDSANTESVMSNKIQDENNHLKLENKELSSRNRELEQQKTQLNEEYVHLQAQYQQLKSEKEQLQQNYNQELATVAQLTEQIKQNPPLEGIAPFLSTLKFIQDNDQLQSLLLNDQVEGEPLGILLIRFIAKAAQWDDVLKLWDYIAQNCKSHNRIATVEEITLLKQVVAIHNLIYRDKSASLYEVNPQDRYDYKQMERGNNASSSDTVAEIWLPGLKNAAQMIVKKVLVKTA